MCVPSIAHSVADTTSEVVSSDDGKDVRLHCAMASLSRKGLARFFVLCQVALI